MGRAWASTVTIVLRAGPGLDILFAGRAGPGPHNSVCGPGLGRVCTTAAGPGRAWASNHICGPGLGLNFRPVQGPSGHGSKTVLWTYEWCVMAHARRRRLPELAVTNGMLTGLSTEETLSCHQLYDGTEVTQNTTTRSCHQIYDGTRVT